MGKENVNMNIDHDLAEKARAEAEKTKRTFSVFIEWVLEQYFSKGKK